MRKLLLALLVAAVFLLLLLWGHWNPVPAQCSGAGFVTFASATHVELHPSNPQQGYVGACYDSSGNLLTLSSLQVPNFGVVMFNFASPQTGYCVVK